MSKIQWLRVSTQVAEGLSAPERDFMNTILLTHSVGQFAQFSSNFSRDTTPKLKNCGGLNWNVLCNINPDVGNNDDR